jgi:hypothetical protein
MFRSYDHLQVEILTKILNNYSNSVALDGNPEPEPDLVHATGCKKPSLRVFISLLTKWTLFLFRKKNSWIISHEGCLFRAVLHSLSQGHFCHAIIKLFNRRRQLWLARFEVFAVMTMTCTIFWNVVRKKSIDVSEEQCLRHACRKFPTRLMHRPWVAVAQSVSDWLRAGRPRGHISSPSRVKSFNFSISSIPYMDPARSSTQ